MSLHPDVIDIMHTVGVTFEQFRAIYRVQWEIEQRRGGESHDLEKQGQTAGDLSHAPRETPEDAAISAIAPATSCNGASVAPLKIPAWKRRRQELRSRGLPANWRGKLNDAPPAIVQVAPAIAGPSPSLKVINLDPEERERVGATLHATCNVAPADGPLIAMTPEWQPNKLGARLGADELGDIGAANCLAKFRDHFEASGLMLTDRQWQARFRKWVRSERGFIRPDPAQPRLPLVQVEPSRSAPPGKTYVRFGSPEWEALNKRAAFPTDRDGGWWFDDAEVAALRRESG